jgi:hypothetical protein
MATCPDDRDVLMWMDDGLQQYPVYARYQDGAQTVWDQNDMGYTNYATAWCDMRPPVKHLTQ